MQNPSLREEARYDPAAVIPLTHETSIIDWLEATGRMVPRDVVEPEAETKGDEIDLTDFMDLGDDDEYDDDDFVETDDE